MFKKLCGSLKNINRLEISQLFFKKEVFFKRNCHTVFAKYDMYKTSKTGAKHLKNLYSFEFIDRYLLFHKDYLIFNSIEG